MDDLSTPNPGNSNLIEVWAWLRERKETADTNLAKKIGSEEAGFWRGQSDLCKDQLNWMKERFPFLY